MKKPAVKLTETYFNKEDGLSIVTISTPLGHFSGHAICNKDDGDEFNEFIGGSFAEARAWVKFYKQAMFLYRGLIKELNAIYCCSNKSEKTCKLVKEQLDFYTDCYEYFKNELAKTQKEIADRNQYLDNKDK